jgi:hypothetical protein
MPTRLKRFYNAKHLHFFTRSLLPPHPWLNTARRGLDLYMLTDETPTVFQSTRASISALIRLLGDTWCSANVRSISRETICWAIESTVPTPFRNQEL